jgi:hypothetical protein
LNTISLLVREYLIENFNRREDDFYLIGYKREKMIRSMIGEGATHIGEGRMFYRAVPLQTFFIYYLLLPPI